MDITDFDAGAEFVDTEADQRLVLEDIPTDGPLFRLPDEEPPFDRYQPESGDFEQLFGDVIQPAESTEN
ncbi:hypothetical protein HLRTI_002921 [Halorhabdus tiamatea SARL4B]|uniref:Uncharacterized protein n=1 Tax=Halorhabdus tiamatea SARL4B TaxID=1033806 RepID=U2DGI0_9EURY|nr:hypothetical protein [Halorhabdus tiamatea]ERJ05122.1 hypothetical protein HLRTI_002921 [Halorhabdus tiamatea SARL4B]